jgi:hypothetical protein
VNPSGEAPTIDDSNRLEYFEHYVPLKFGSVLYSKLRKRYWELAHVGGRPLLIAVQDFHAPQSMTWSSSALVEYLYGIRQVERIGVGGKAEIVSERVEKYTWKGKNEIPAGFFFQPEVENISAIIANPVATLSKFNRMGFVAGFGRRDIRMLRKGICYRDSVTPQEFVSEVHSAEYTETWCEGLSVYHNPRARFPLDPCSFPNAAHHTSRGGQIICRLPKFHPVGSVTVNVIPC